MTGRHQAPTRPEADQLAFRESCALARLQGLTLRAEYVLAELEDLYWAAGFDAASRCRLCGEWFGPTWQLEHIAQHLANCAAWIDDPADPYQGQSLLRDSVSSVPGRGAA